MDLPRIAVTLGDPRGIGPEIVARALCEPDPLEADTVLVGPEGAAHLIGHTAVSVGEWGGEADDEVAGKLSYLAIERAVQMATSGEVDAIVTAPISKAALAAAGHRWPGHTEMLKDLAGVPHTALCMASDKTSLGGPLRVVLVTGHISLREVPGALTEDRLCRTARLAHEDLRRFWGIAEPRLALCALNPHASEGGLFGDEEERVYGPAVASLRDEGIRVLGPFPADTVFLRAMRGDADAVLAPYHDVGMAAIKTASFGTAVNVTLGLPFPRTSPGHGTAFDIVGSGKADPGPMRAALELATAFAKRALTSRAMVDRLPQG